MRTRGWIATVALLVGLAPAAVEACAVCLSGGAGGDRLAEAYNWSVLFLMGAPYLVLGSVGGWIFYAHRSAAKKRDPDRRKARVYPVPQNAPHVSAGMNPERPELGGGRRSFGVNVLNFPERQSPKPRTPGATSAE